MHLKPLLTILLPHLAIRPRFHFPGKSLSLPGSPGKGSGVICIASRLTLFFEHSQFTVPSWGHNTSIVDAVGETRDLNHVCYVAINKVFGNFVSFNTQFDYSSLSVYPQFNFVLWVIPRCFGDGAGGFLHLTCPCNSDNNGIVPRGAVCT